MTAYFARTMTIRDRVFDWGARTYVMGIVNVSPESFSGDGLSSVDAAVAQAVRFEADGADIIDIGGMSTRPNFKEVSPEDERDRVVPAIRAIEAAVSLPISIDTYRSSVALAALEAGAQLVNDVTGFRDDPRMASVVSEWGAPAVVMHNQRGRTFHDVVGDIRAGFVESLVLADAAGVGREKIILDPGFGFGWASAHSLEMIRRLAELQDFGLPLLMGSSRKSVIGDVLGLPENERAWGTAATVSISIANGADIVRVHDVAEMVQVCRVTDALVRGWPNVRDS